MKTKRISRSYALATVLMAALSPAFARDPFPMQPSGLNETGTILSSGKDHVDMASGNVSLTLPLTSDYPLDGLLSLQLVASYNLNFWRRVFFEKPVRPGRRRDLLLRRLRPGLRGPDRRPSPHPASPLRRVAGDRSRCALAGYTVMVLSSS